MPKLINYNQGSIIYFEGDKDGKVYILQKGLVVLSGIDMETKQTTNTVVKEGEFFGIKTALGKSQRDETATAAANSVCIVMTLPEFESYFVTNKTLIMKMLRIFSKELKTVHAKTTKILNMHKDEDDMAVGRKERVKDGLFAVAKSFFEDEKWQSCIGACARLVKQNPEYTKNTEVAQMLKKSMANATSAKKKEEAERNLLIRSGEYNPLGNNGLPSDYQSDSAEKAFDLPAFSRFAKTYENGEIIIAEFEKGETFYLIQRGIVQLTKCVNGTNKNLDILNPGELFGEMAILDNSPRSATCVAKGRVDCLEFNKENFEILITGNPQIALMLLKLFCKRISDQTRRLKILTFDDKQARLADLMCMFDETGSLPPVTLESDAQSGKVIPKDRRVFPLTVSDIAHWAGLSVEDVKNEMAKMTKNGLIKAADNYVIINNINDMRRTVENRIKIMNMHSPNKNRTQI
ncbi:MAG: cyclic nucleotide-binding domain-containing protein [Treponema sp.]|nr:cyclic nucleotide-binding domain-containing protein [Treponema sp.]